MIKNVQNSLTHLKNVPLGLFSAVYAADNQVQIDANKVGFKIPNLGDVLTFGIRIVFIVGGILALVYLLLGAISWITSGGDKDAVDKARNKITNALIGIILIAVVLAIIVTLEQVVFQKAICLGLSCPITIPSLLRCGGAGEPPCL